MVKQKWLLAISAIFFLVVLSACSVNEDAQDGQFSSKAPEVVKNPEKKQKDPNAEYESQTSGEKVHISDIDIEADESITKLVNKTYGFKDSYTPDDLVTVDVPTVLDNNEINQLRKVAADALADMFAEAKKEGVKLYARSGYRSYETQVELFNNYAKQHGEEEANQFSAKPGHSEHQTGLVMDVTSESVDFALKESFGETKEGKWLQNHAHEFGFIIRYPKGKEDITGYTYEPWHIRYLGKDVATKVFESGLAYEEFLVKEGILDEKI